MKSGYTLGLASVSFRGHTPREVIAAAAEAGLDCIEWGSDVHAPHTGTARLHEIAELQKGYGITCSSYGTYFRLGKTPIAELEGYIAAAKMLGTGVLRLWCGDKSGAEMCEAEKEELLAVCRTAAEIAEKNSVTLCMECHKKTFTENPCDAVWLMQAVHSTCFRMYWQPFQWQSSEQNIKNAEKIAPYAEHIHVFHWKGEKKLPLTEAVPEWRKYLGCFSVPRVLLLEFMPNGTPGELKDEADALKIIVGESL